MADVESFEPFVEFVNQHSSEESRHPTSNDAYLENTVLFRCFAEGKTPFIRGDLAKLLLYTLLPHGQDLEIYGPFVVFGRYSASNRSLNFL